MLRYSQVLLFPRVTLVGAVMQSQNRALTCPSYRITSRAADSLICERKRIAKQNSTHSLCKREKHRLAVL